ncbi:MAG: hypothetical protein LBO77_05325 [Desulfovibrio sp.]|nr:hypothetical protein [Desulfovibrio sp.]
MLISQRLEKIQAYARKHFTPLDAPHPACVLFLSFSDGRRKATVLRTAAPTLDEAWATLQSRMRAHRDKNKGPAPWLRLDWADWAEIMEWRQFREALRRFKRNYFRYGLTLDPAFRYALPELECNANMLFYTEKDSKAQVQEETLAAYCQKLFGQALSFPLEEERKVGIFSLTGVFCGPEGGLNALPGANDARVLPPPPHAKASNGPASTLFTGRRRLQEVTRETLDGVILRGSRALAAMCGPDGEFIYGHLGAKGTRLTSYNVVRHAGTLLALIDSLEHTGDESLRPAIEAGIRHMTGPLLRLRTLGNGREAAFVVESGGEIKLGGNGLALVALGRWTRHSGSREFLPLMAKLGEGIAWMQRPDGTFNHVYMDGDAPELLAANRVIYYDGEGLFGLALLHAASGEERWLDISLRALDAFLLKEHWKNHDHWLSYATNEITLIRPEDRYFLFGLKNVSGFLNFILHRETAYPTLLEQCMAADKMIRRLEAMPDKRRLLEGFDLPKFRLATQRRAEFLLNGVYWPEVAMYFPHPQRLVDGFFIRHHGFRLRIDDAAHYLCGLCAYAATLEA